MRILHLFGEAEGPPIPEVQLTHESLDGAGEDGPFDVVTVTDAPNRAAGLLNSVPWPLRLRFLRPAAGDKPWRFNWFDTERHLLSYVSFLRRRGLGDRLVLYADGFDTAWLGCQRDLPAALEALGREVFFGVEFDLYPAGLPGYPRPARSHSVAAEELGKERGRPLPFCREPQPLMERWELEPPNETEPCLAATQDDVEAVFLNGGVYGGRAAALERALRRLLSRQRLLATNQASGSAYRVSGRTHQYLWNQYFLDRPHEVGLDYGGSFVVNLARRSLAPQQFGLAEDTGSIRSVVFQRSVCIAHANGAGYADSTLSLLRAAATFRFDTTALVGVHPEDFDEISMRPLTADADKGDRVLLDTAMCFSRMKTVVTWHGALAAVDLVIPEHFATYQGMQFVVLRYKGSKRGGTAVRSGRKGGSRSTLAHVFDVIEAQHTPLWKHGQERQNTTIFSSRNRFDISPFRLHVRQGDCVGWRCQGRCDVAYADFTGAEDVFAPEGGGSDSGLLKRGAWLGRVSGGVQAGDALTFSTWKPRAYVMGILAEVSGIGFYEPEDGG